MPRPGYSSGSPLWLDLPQSRFGHSDEEESPWSDENRIAVVQPVASPFSNWQLSCHSSEQLINQR